MLAGAGQLDREVNWVVASRSRLPMFQGIRGNDLAVLSTEVMRLADPDRTFAEVVRALAATGVAGILVLELPDEAGIQAAERGGLPLLYYPAEAALLREVEQEVLRYIVNRREQLQQRAREFFRRFAEVALHDSRPDPVVRELAEITGKAAILTDPLGRVLGVSGGTGTFDLERVTLPPQVRPEGTVQRVELAELADPVYLAPIPGPTGPQGFLILAPADGGDRDLEETALAQAATAIAAVLGRQRPDTDRVRVSLLEELLTGRPVSYDLIRAQARRIGYDLDGRLAVAVVEVEGNGADFGRMLSGGLRFAGRPLLAAPYQGKLTVILPAVDGQLITAAEGVRQAVAERVGGQAFVGVGRPYAELRDLSRSYREACRALGLARKLGLANRPVLFDRLGFFRLLTILADEFPAEVRSFVDETLGKLAEYDRENRSDLVETLRVCLESNLNVSEAAEKLHVHRNTLLYRLRRVEEISGWNLENPDSRLALHLAVKLLDLLD